MITIKKATNDTVRDLDDSRLDLWMIMAWMNMLTTMVINVSRENITWKTMDIWRMFAVWLLTSKRSKNVAADIQSAKTF